MTHFVTGFILCSRDFGEDDRLYTVYTREVGKQEYIAQGARKIKSKLAGSLETVAPVRLFIARGKRFDRIAGVEMVGSRLPFHGAVFFRMLFGITNDLTHEGLRDERLFALMQEAYETIAVGTAETALADAYLWKLLAILGYRAELDRCVVCRGALPDAVVSFDAHAGGTLCFACAVQREVVRDRVSVHPEGLAELRRARATSLGAFSARATSPVFRTVGDAVLHETIGRPWAGRSIFEHLLNFTNVKFSR